MARVFLRERISNRIKKGHPWIYDNEVEKVEGEFEDGDIVGVFRYDRTFLGRGFINEKSKIRVRLLTRRNEKIDEDFFRKKIEEAVRFRKKYVKDTDAFRVFFSESDGISGLIVDKYSEYVVVQFNSLGVYKWRDAVVNVLIELLEPKGIYHKPDKNICEKEGIPQDEGWLFGDGPELLEYRMNGVTLFADLRGQKTGAFLDQRENAKMLMEFVEDRVCLDAFSYTGNFAVHLLKGGAKHVTLLDYSNRALEIAKLNLDSNGFKGSYDLVNVNAFDQLKKYHEDNVKYDLIVLDPPSFAKSPRSKSSALRGYKEINLRAMKILRNNGILATSSCTRIVSESDFEKVLFDAGGDARCLLKTISRGFQPIDHPTILNIPETRYLKFFILEVMRI